MCLHRGLLVVKFILGLLEILLFCNLWNSTSLVFRIVKAVRFLWRRLLRSRRSLRNRLCQKLLVVKILTRFATLHKILCTLLLAYRHEWVMLQRCSGRWWLLSHMETENLGRGRCSGAEYLTKQRADSSDVILFRTVTRNVSFCNLSFAAIRIVWSSRRSIGVVGIKKSLVECFCRVVYGKAFSTPRYCCQHQCAC